MPAPEALDMNARIPIILTLLTMSGSIVAQVVGSSGAVTSPLSSSGYNCWTQAGWNQAVPIGPPTAPEMQSPRGTPTGPDGDSIFSEMESLLEARFAHRSTSSQRNVIAKRDSNLKCTRMTSPYPAMPLPNFWRFPGP